MRDVSIGVARSPSVKGANMAEVVSATPPKAPCRAPRARFGRGGIPKREDLNALAAAGPSIASANRGRESTETVTSNARRPGEAPRQAGSRPGLTLARGTNLVLRRLTPPITPIPHTTPLVAAVFKGGHATRPNGQSDR